MTNFFHTVADYLYDMGDYLYEMADWCESWVGNWAQPMYYTSYYAYLAGQYIQNGANWLDGIYTDASNALNDASNALSKVVNLENWKSTIQGALDWVEDTSNNFYSYVRNQVWDLFNDVSELYSNFTTWARDAVMDIILDVQDLVNNFEIKVWNYAYPWFNKVDDLSNNFSPYVLDVLGLDWTDLVNFIRDFPNSVLDPVHELFSSWLDEKTDQIYTYITDRLEDFWGKLQAKMEEKAEDNAEWWFNLAEKVIEKI